jgi:hypothetical protein
MKTDAYKGKEIKIWREEDYRDSPHYPHEFILEIDGEKETTATELEQKGFSREDYGGWTNALFEYAKELIDERNI